MDALRHPKWGDAARKEMDTDAITNAIVKVDRALAHEAIRTMGADLVVHFPV